MKTLHTLLLCTLMLIPQASTHTASLATTLAHDCIDTLKTGVPIALSSAILWHIFYRIPHHWPDVSQPTADFIRTTWKAQGLKDADQVLLKRIPDDSFMAKVVVYTQELPGALVVGLPFIKRVEKLLEQQEQIRQRLTESINATTQKQLHAEYELLEQELDECRFVCGHERVHQERHHAYKLLFAQCCAPFLVYMTFKQAAQLLRNYNLLPFIAAYLEWETCRSAAQIGILWMIAHLYEQQADLHASTDPRVIKAGIKLFKRAQQQKVPEMGPVGYRVKLMSWVLKYTHPVLQERIWYLSLALKKLNQPLESSTELGACVPP